MRAEALTSISENYHQLQLTWEAAMEVTKDTEMRARIGGANAQMEKFDFFFGVELGRKILNMVDNLSRSLQSQTMSASDGQMLVNMTITLFISLRSEDRFDLFWNYVEQRRSSVEVNSLALSRRRKLPRKFVEGESVQEFPSTVQEKYKRIYFEAIDLVVYAIKQRFMQKGFQMLQKLENILTSEEQTEQSEDVMDVIQLYGSDFYNRDRLLLQLDFLHTQSGKRLTDLHSIVTYLKSLSSVEKDFYSEVIKLVN